MTGVPKIQWTGGKNREFAIADVADCIDTFYNRVRRHSHLGGLSPEQFEATHKPRRCLH